MTTTQETKRFGEWKMDFPNCPKCGKPLMVGRYGPNGWESKCIDCDKDYILSTQEGSK